GSAQSEFENGEVVSVEELLRRNIATESDVARLRKLSLLLSEFERYPRTAVDSKTPEPDPVRIEESPVEARLTLLPAKRRGRDLSYEQLFQKLKDRGIIHGL